MTKKTKIVATIGPASDTTEQIGALIWAGVNVFRFNMKHNEHSWHRERIVRVKQVAKQMGVTVGILIDLQGPEIRIKTRDKQPIPLGANEVVVFSNSFDDPQVNIVLSHDNILSSLELGDQILIDDGFIELNVVKKEGHKIVAATKVPTVIKDHKGLNLPSKDIDVPSLTDDDLDKLSLAAEEDADFVGLSFARTKQDLDILQAEMDKRGVKAKIISKIENQKSLDNIDELIQNSGAVMIARGDLGVEVPIEQLAFWETTIINKCREAGKPVIVATQMLHSMIENSRPTNAEATDVANAVLQGTDALMLSGETATGQYPVKAVEMMAQIAIFNEPKAVVKDLEHVPNSLTELIARGAFEILKDEGDIKLDAIVAFTQTGKTAEIISSFRPNIPIIAVTESGANLGKMALSFGVIPVYATFPSGKFTDPEAVLEALVQKEILQKGQTVLVVHGKNWKMPGLTNSLSIVTL